MKANLSVIGVEDTGRFLELITDKSPGAFFWCGHQGSLGVRLFLRNPNDSIIDALETHVGFDKRSLMSKIGEVETH